jgi:hypothetical protein
MLSEKLLPKWEKPMPSRLEAAESVNRRGSSVINKLRL